MCRNIVSASSSAPTSTTQLAAALVPAAPTSTTQLAAAKVADTTQLPWRGGKYLPCESGGKWSIVCQNEIELPIVSYLLLARTSGPGPDYAPR